MRPGHVHSLAPTLRWLSPNHLHSTRKWKLRSGHKQGKHPRVIADITKQGRQTLSREELWFASKMLILCFQVVLILRPWAARRQKWIEQSCKYTSAQSLQRHYIGIQNWSAAWASASALSTALVRGSRPWRLLVRPNKSELRGTARPGRARDFSC